MIRWLKGVLGNRDREKKGGFDVESYCKGRSVGRREMRENPSEAARVLVKRRWDRVKKGRL
jgi:hypothetical protein